MAITAPPLGATVVYRSRTNQDHAAIVARNYGDGTFDLYVILPYADGTEYKRKVPQADAANPAGASFTYDPTAVSNSLAPPGAPGIIKAPPPGTTGVTAIATQQDVIDLLGVPTNLRVVQYTANSSWTVPTGVNWLRLDGVGGGGAGGQGAVSTGISNQAGAGGGGAGASVSSIINVTSGNILNITVGVGGIAGGAAAGLTFVQVGGSFVLVASRGTAGQGSGTNSSTVVMGGLPGAVQTSIAVPGAGGPSSSVSGVEYGVSGSGGGGGGSATATNGGNGGAGGKRGNAAGYSVAGTAGGSADVNGQKGGDAVANTGGGGGGGGGGANTGTGGAGGNGGSGVLYVTILG